MLRLNRCIACGTVVAILLGGALGFPRGVAGPPPCANCGSAAPFVDGAVANHCSHSPPCIDGCCIPNSQAYGFYPTQWRKWPVAQVAAAAPLGGQGISPPKLELPPPRDEIGGPPVLTPSTPPGLQETGPTPGLNPAPTPPAELKSEPSPSVIPALPSQGAPDLLPTPSPSATPQTTIPPALPSPLTEPSQRTEPPLSTEAPSAPGAPDRSLPLPSLLTPPETPEPSATPTATPDRSQTAPADKQGVIAQARWTPAQCSGPQSRKSIAR